MARNDRLPIADVLDDLRQTLAAHTSAVLVAPPGAGKTTGVPPALLEAPWLRNQRILVLEPRRIAARAAAERMAETRGEAVGETIGIRARLDTRVSTKTRIEVVTEGVFTRTILDDPALEGVGLVIFDEFHERSLDADLGLALALDAQAGLREDLRLLVMSATLDGARVADVMGNAPVIQSEGRAFPVTTHYVGRPPERTSTADAIARAVTRALREDAGSILAFLPGQGEIRRAEERLREALTAPDTDIVALHGGLDGRAQRAAILPPPAARRKVVLATAIAQTSVTIDGVRVVVDCGLERLPRYDPAAGVTRLETVRASRATVDQRRGRAGRTEPGVCYRLWSEPETQGFPAFTAPEILAADLSSLVLDCAAWGVTAPETLKWLDPPPPGARAAAHTELRQLGAIDASGTLTPLGRHLRTLPLAPRLAAMVLRAVNLDPQATNEAALIAAILSERGAGGTSVDLDERLASLRRDNSPRSKALRQLANSWARVAIGLNRPLTNRQQPETHAERSTAALLAIAFPDRIAKARGQRGTFLMANGRACQIDPASSLAGAPFTVVAELSGLAAGARVLLAAALSEPELEAIATDRISTQSTVDFDPQAGALKARTERRLGAIILANETRAVPADEQSAMALAEGAARIGIGKLKWSNAQRQLRDRVRFMRNALSATLQPDQAGSATWPDLTDEALAATAATWLAPFIVGLTRLSEIGADRLGNALDSLLPWHLKLQLDTSVPTHFTAPTGNRHAIDYETEGAPVVALRVQELFGLKTHPAIADGKLPLTLHLLSPAGRPIQITRDLPGFWAGSWREVKAEMKGRYPKHVWPDDPASAQPTARAKPRGT
ncbi:MAG: ATP-dependent helicase HrpB [Hyphomicrobiaceae bacterium]